MKRFTAIILAFILAILLPFTASAATPNDFESNLTGLENHVQSVQLPQSIQAGQPDDWAVIALARAGVLTAGNQAAYLNKIQAETNLSGSSLEKVIIALKAMKLDPTNFNGRNLINDLSRDTSFKYFSEDIYALIALNGYADKLPADAVNTPTSLIQKILSQADSNGGWGYAGPPADVDTTGAAMAALAPYQDQPQVKDAINKATDYLGKAELPDGGFSNWGENSDSAAEAVIGLTSVGIDPTVGQFDKSGKNPLNNLYSFRSGDGYFWQSGSPEDPMTNDEVLKAFVAYKAFLSGGKLFVFPSASVSAPVVTTPAKKKPVHKQSKQSTEPAVKKIVPKKTTVKVAAKASQPISAPESAAKTSAATIVTKQLTQSAENRNTSVSGKLATAKSEPAAAKSKTHKPAKNQGTTKHPQATGSKKNASQTEATHSAVVNTVYLIIGIIVVLLGAAALIFRKKIWGSRA